MATLAALLTSIASATGATTAGVDLSAFGGEAANARAVSGPVAVLVDPAGALPQVVSTDVADRMSLLYETDDGVRDILGGAEGMRSLPWLFRQEPSTSGPGAMLGGGNAQRMVKVSGQSLADEPSAAGIAHLLRSAINRTCTTPAGVSTCLAHRVTIDEIGAGFGRLGGPSATGRRLSDAMALLSREASPWGGTYASRVHFLVAPGVTTSVTAGLGANRTLGHDGLTHRRNYRDVFTAMAQSGGVWLEMYHFSRGAGMTAFTAAEWRDVPVGVAAFLTAVRPARDPLTYMHVVMTTTPGDPSVPGPACSTPGVAGGPTVPGVPACAPVPEVCQALPWRPARSFPAYGRSLLTKRAREIALVMGRAERSLTPVAPGSPQVIREPGVSPMQCQWLRAQTGAVNTRILINGPGSLRATNEQAITWGALFRQFFLASPSGAP